MSSVPTLEAVAQLAGVSRSTVSRVVNDSPRVAPEARQAVRNAIAQLGYVPNQAARSLVTRRTNSFALVVGEAGQTVFENPFFGVLISGLGDRLDEANQTTILLMGRTASDERRTEAYLRAGHVDGVVFAALPRGEALPMRLHAAGTPVVLSGRPLTLPGLPYADVDNVEAARSGVEHLLQRGRRTIATVTGRRGEVPTLDRLRGYQLALDQAGLVGADDLVEDGGFSWEQGRCAMAALLERRPDIDAVLVASDPMAAGVMQALRVAGRSVPDDVAVVSIDGTILATMSEPPLTTVQQPAYELGAALADLVMARARGEHVEPIILPTRLVQGATT